MRAGHKKGRWVVNTTNGEYISYVSRLSGLSRACSQVLINRGIKTEEQIRFFRNAHKSSLSDPFVIDGIDCAVARIKRAIRNREKILISGDYDADGLTATAIVLEGLRRMGVEPYYFIPHRLKDGYGFGPSALSAALRCDATLIITVDSGITSFETLRDAMRYGLDVIVTDHHEPLTGPEGIVLPEAFCIVNPKLMSQCTEPYNLYALSGAGVALKLVQALTGDKALVESLMDLAAIGTSADVVSVLGENRVILNRGLKLIQEGNRLGIRALKDAAGLSNGYFKNSLLYYAINPRINAPGRIDDPYKVVRLLTTTSLAEASEIAQWMGELNTKRQRIEETVFQEAIQQVERGGIGDGAIVVASGHWHLGVVGIVASRLVELYGVPSFVLVIEEGIAKGSGRSCGEFDLLEGLRSCAPLLERFGGHKQAAGLSIKAELLDLFRAEISKFARQSFRQEEVPTITVDALIGLGEVTHEFVEEINTLGPFGHCNHEPLFGSKALEVVDSRIVGDNHLRINVRQNGKVFNCIAFDMADMEQVLSGGFIDALYLPTVNKQYNNIQLQIKACRASVR
jgi:single-stranded-DNA-specific exonuclease